MTIRIRDPLDLVSVIPYHLGYHPERSLVIVALRGETVGVVVRVDLDVPAGERLSLSRHIAVTTARDGALACFAVVFETRAGEGDALTEMLLDELEGAGIDVIEHLVVRDGRVFFPRCFEGCHPWEGVLLRRPETVAAVAELVGLGRAPVRDREALDELMAPADTAFARRCRRDIDRLLAQRDGSGAELPQSPPHSGPQSRPAPTRSQAAAVRSWATLLSSYPDVPLTVRQVAHVAVSLADKDFRDAIIGWLCPGCLPDSMVGPRLGRRLDRSLFRPSPDEAIAQLCWLARHTSPSVAPGVLTVLATVAWSAGDGALARVALTRALAVDPGYTLALLLERLVAHGIRLTAAPPSTHGARPDAQAS
jgi:hypothetical protein